MTPENEKQVERVLIIVIIGLALITLIGGIVWLFTSRISPTSPTALFTKNYEADSTETSGTSEQENQSPANAPSLESTAPALAPQNPAAGAGEVGSPSTTPVPTYARPQPRFGSSSATPTPTSTPTPTPTSTPALTSIMSETTVDANSAGSTSVECPTGTTLVGGGFETMSGRHPWQSYQAGQRWNVVLRNDGAGSSRLRAYAQCVSNLAGSVATNTNTVTVSSGSTTPVTATCPAGQTAISGGFQGDKLDVIFSNKIENGWRAIAKNSSGSARPLTVLVNCYSGTLTLTTVQKSQDVPASWGAGDQVTCTEGMLIMGGYSFASPMENSYYQEIFTRWTVGAQNLTSSTARLKTYGYCATF